MSKGTAQPVAVSIAGPQTVTIGFSGTPGSRSFTQQVGVTQSVAQQVVLINPSQRLGG